MTKTKPIDKAKFVTLWQRSKTMPEFLENFGKLTRTQASMFAYYLRSKGVALKHLPRGGGKKKDYTQLARLAQKAKGGK